ncbi:MAG: hypothetical protein HOW73_08320 [Polyangiaceae bacterium]|nr:hypothetical protein [Polyangiaceae bacterium]
MSNAGSIVAAVVGAGARTAVGRSLLASAAAVRAGIAHFTPHPFLSDRRGRRVNVARAPWLSADRCGAARFVELAVAAATEALESVTGASNPLSIFVGLPEERPGRPHDIENSITGALAVTPAFRDRIGPIVTIPEGHASALIALDMACSAIARGDAELCLVGGVDSWLEPASIDHLLGAGRLHGPSRPWGFVPGEAAAFCVLASLRWTAKHHVAAPLSVIATATSTEPAPMGSKRVCTGRGLGDAFAQALSPLRESRERATRVIGDLNGEAYRVDELGFAMARSADAIERPGAVLVPASSWGDVGAASGALFAGLAFMDAKRTCAASRTTLVWGSSEAGRRAAASFRSEPSIETEEAS